jgi:hypothetical protein
MQRTSIPPTDVDSTFEPIESSPTERSDAATAGFRGTHAHGEYTVRREYRPHIEAGTLEIRSEYYVGGTLVQSNTRRLIEDERSSRFEASIAEFCRADHHGDPGVDIETAIEAADRYSRANRES